MPGDNERYEFGPFLVDPGERLLVRGEEPVSLAPKSFDVLCALVRNSGRLLDKDFLLSSVWPDAAVEENSVAKAVAEIRKALGEGPRENRFIATVARRGYRFVPEVRVVVARGPVANSVGNASAERAITLAVLPFAWLTQEGRDTSLAIGLADSLITRFSNLPHLIVRPTSCILKYADRDLDTVEIASELRADYVVTGSLQQSGERVRVTVQMVAPDQPRSVWADRFEETFTHIFVVEDAVSERIAAALALELTQAQRRALAQHSTNSSEAYQLYLRGLYFWSRQTSGSALKAMAYFRQAIDVDPAFALAWAGIADAYILIALSGTLTGGLPPGEIFPEAKRAALRAIELQDDLSKAHAAMGFIKFFYEWDSSGARQHFDRAVMLRPQCAGSRHGYAFVCGFLGHHHEALRQMELALEIEPLSSVLNANHAYLLYLAHRFQDSENLLKKLLETDAKFAPAHYRLGLTCAEQNKHDEALSHFENARRLSNESPETLAALGYMYGRTGSTQSARHILQRLNDISKTRYVSAVLPAEIHIGMGEYTEALSWLEKALDERTPALVRLRVEPRFDSVMSDSRFQQLMLKMQPASDSD